MKKILLILLVAFTFLLSGCYSDTKEYVDLFEACLKQYRIEDCVFLLEDTKYYDYYTNN